MNEFDEAPAPATRWSVITVTYNSAAELEQCWDDPDKPYEWIVVDNCSSDSSVETARRLGASRVIELPHNIGFSKANNVALAEADKPYVLFGNPDLRLSLDGFAPLQAHLDVHGGLVAPQLLSSSGEVQPNGRGFPYVTAKLGNRQLWPFSWLHESYRLTAAPGSAIWVAWIIGAAVAARRADFVKMGGWDERFFLYYEDVEVGLRSWRLGHPVAVLGDVRWTHKWGRATNSLRWSRAHTLEVQSARRFYREFPEFVLGVPSVQRRHAFAARLIGLPVNGTPP